MLKKRAIFPKTLPGGFTFVLLLADNCCRSKSREKVHGYVISEEGGEANMSNVADEMTELLRVSSADIIVVVCVHPSDARH